MIWIILCCKLFIQEGFQWKVDCCIVFCVYLFLEGSYTFIIWCLLLLKKSIRDLRYNLYYYYHFYLWFSWVYYDTIYWSGLCLLYVYLLFMELFLLLLLLDIFNELLIFTWILLAVCNKCIYKKITEENLSNCPVCNIYLGCAPLDKLR